MHIVLNIGGIPFNGNTINERSLGGSESAGYYVAKELAARGHEVVMFTEDLEGGVFDKVKYIYRGEESVEAPLGSNYHFYVENTPHDVNICQRHPAAYLRPNQAKINLWWVHDIALKRNISPVTGQAWQIDAVMPVSHWFKQQIVETWNLNPDIIQPIHNGVDYSLFDKFELKQNHLPGDDPIKLIYSSRPERGLDKLVGENGIMERLAVEGHNVQLKVCGYEHAAADQGALGGLYAHLRERIELLPNCEHLGSLTKEQLYELMCTEADVWCYPTSFEEVSCITAMEAMAAGLTICTTTVAALPETIADYPNVTMFNDDEELVNKTVGWLQAFNNKFRRRSKRDYTWFKTVDEIESIIKDCFKKRKTLDNVARHYLRHSDIIALEKLYHDDKENSISPKVTSQLSLYDWKNNVDDYGEHYADGTEEMYDSDDFRYEEGFENHPRFQAVAGAVLRCTTENTSLNIIDYGCAHGHFTNYLAKAFPQHQFIGIDVSPKAIDIAEEKAEEWDLENVSYITHDWLKHEPPVFPDDIDILIIGEILEHVPDPYEFMETCRRVVGNGTTIVVTTPFGPWEFNSYEKEYPKRYHLHHFERADIYEMFGHYEDFDFKTLPAGSNLVGELLGWYVYTFTFQDNVLVCGSIDYTRKFAETAPKQTVSLCVIAKDAENDIPRLIKSVEPVIDEIIVGIDETTTDDTFNTIHRVVDNINDKQHRCPALPLKVFYIPAAVDTGFDQARNQTIQEASMDWIMWADCDEEFISGERVWKYLRNNQWRGYGTPQHHFSTEPLGVLSTDYPVRLFRNNENVRFFGVVHEHPERPEILNEGVGHAVQLYDIHFSHYGYKTEKIRRARFDRNIRLMARDRQTYPDRILGKFLWIRDLALMCRFELEQTGGVVSDQMRVQAVEGVTLWEKALDEHGSHPQTIRMVRDHLEFYNTLVNVIGQGFVYSMKFSTGIDDAPDLGQVPELRARFLNRRHLDKFLSTVIDGEVNQYEEKYL